MHLVVSTASWPVTTNLPANNSACFLWTARHVPCAPTYHVISQCNPPHLTVTCICSVQAHELIRKHTIAPGTGNS